MKPTPWRNSMQHQRQRRQTNLNSPPRPLLASPLLRGPTLRPLPRLVCYAACLTFIGLIRLCCAGDHLPRREFFPPARKARFAHAYEIFTPPPGQKKYDAFKEQHKSELLPRKSTIDRWAREYRRDRLSNIIATSPLKTRLFHVSLHKRMDLHMG